MKPFSAFLLFLSLLVLLGINLVDARRSPAAGEDYWKNIMNNEPIPEAISDLLHQQTESNSAESDDDKNSFSMSSKHYIRNFDIRPNVILYHNDNNINADSKRTKISADHHVRVKMLHHGNNDDDDDKHVKLKLLVSDSNE